MYRKLLISIGILLAIVFSCTICFANNGLQDAADGVRNIVGGAENAIEGAAKDISNASKDATGDMENKANQLGNDVKNSANDVANGVANATTNMVGRTNNDYTATRTSAETGATFMGMNATAWTWLIIGIAAIAIIALVWYYSMQLNSSNDRD